MLVIEKSKAMNFEGAMRGMRNPMNSWDKSDSYFVIDHECINVTGLSNLEYERLLDNNAKFMTGGADLQLAQNLCLAGSDHGKLARQIFVCVDITAPLYWWKEFDTYKIATTANSTSTMHKLGSKILDSDDFSFDQDIDDIEYDPEQLEEAKYRQSVMDRLNAQIAEWKHLTGLVKDTESQGTKTVLRQRAKRVWRRMVQDLPSSFNQTRTVTLDYENLRNIYFARRNHKLTEWHTVCHWIESLPYSFLITEPRLSVKEKHQTELINSISTSIKEAHTIINEIKPTMFVTDNKELINTLMEVGLKLLTITNLLQSPDPTAN